MLKKTMIALIGATVTGVCVAGSAEAFVRNYDLSWEGNNGYSMSGMFSFDDELIGLDMLVDETELLSFTANFFDPSDTLFISYDLTNQSSIFNFNFEADTEIVLQDFPPAGDRGLIIGDTNAYLFVASSFCPGTVLVEGEFCPDAVDNGGVVLATATAVESVPEPASLLGLAAVGAVALGGVLKQKSV